jgi:hypothetical protein
MYILHNILYCRILNLFIYYGEMKRWVFCVKTHQIADYLKEIYVLHSILFDEIPLRGRGKGWGDLHIEYLICLDTI